MQTLDSPLTRAEEPSVTALRQECAALRKMLVASLLFLLVLSGSVNLYLLRQMISARKDLAELRPRVEQRLAEYQKNEEPAIKAFIENLRAFAAAHPDFAPVLAKYKISPMSHVVNRAPPIAPEN
jgi:hypothetical protein